MEKNPVEKDEYTLGAPEYEVSASPQLSDAQVGDLKTAQVQEAAGVYGDIQTAEDYGYVARGYG